MSEQPKVDNLLHISWNDSRWIPHLNSSNALDYFSEKSNPFYNRECNNEFIKMQQNTRMDQMQNMTGLEYVLLHAQEPILYIIRKQQRHSPTQVQPEACYHMIGGQVFQTPDLGSIINSRLTSSINHLNGAFSELQSIAGYHPSKGYYWQSQKQNEESEKKKSRKEEVASMFQRRRVDLLLSDLAAKFPPKSSPAPTQEPKSQTSAQPQHNGTASNKSNDVKSEVKVETKVKTEIKDERGIKPPPEKRTKLGS